MLKLTTFLDKICFRKGNGVGEDCAVLRRVSPQPISLCASPSCHAESISGARKMSHIDEWVCLGDWDLAKSCTDSHQLFSQAQSMASVADIVLADLSCTIPSTYRWKALQLAAFPPDPGCSVLQASSLISVVLSYFC